MAEHKDQFALSIETLFQGIDQLVTTKTVVGDAVKVDDAIILPLMDVSCGMAAGAFDENAKKKGFGGMNAKMSPSAILIIQNGSTRLINIKDQNTVNKMLDMVPDLVNRFTGGNVTVGQRFSQDAVKTAESMAESPVETREDL